MNKTGNITAEKAASFGVFILLAVYPIVINNKYFNITATRYLFFTVSSAAFLTACLLLKIKSAESLPKLTKLNISLFSPADISFALFVIVVALSSFLSPHGVSLTMSGAGGRRMGFIMILAMFFAYIFISKFYRIREYEFLFFGVIGTFAAIFGLLQYIGLDPLGFLKGLNELDKVRFISFMGNINIYSSYICILLPLAMYMFCFSEKKSNAFIWLAVVSASFIGLLTAISDSGYIGLAAALVVLAVLTAKEKKKFQRFFAVIITLLVSAGIFNIVWKTFGDPERPSSVLNDIIINPVVIVTGCVISAIIILLLKIFDFSEKFYKGIRGFIIVAAVLAVVAGVGLVIWFTLIDTDTDVGRFSNYLRFNQRWGNGRGYAWTKLIGIFKELPFHQKLIGTGPETLVYEMGSRFGDEMYELFGFHFDNAHNDLVQYLITVGSVGMLAYVVLVVSALKSCVKSENVLTRAMMLPIVAFFAQSMVNITQPITTPLFFVFIALSQCIPSEEQQIT